MTYTNSQGQNNPLTQFPESTQVSHLQLYEEFRHFHFKGKHLSSKVILNDYHKVFVEFARSTLALPYMINFAEKHVICLKDFKRILEAIKRPVSRLQKIWVLENGDSPRLRGFKLVFRDLCEVFLKNFCFDWIFGPGKDEKMKYLNLRGKLLRRVWKLQALDNI